MGSLLEIGYLGFLHGERYGNMKELKEAILHKRVVSIDRDKVQLENGIVLTIELSEADCCAGGGGQFEFDEENPPLDAMITDINIGEEEDVPDDDTIVTRNTITLFHNQNEIIKANAETDAGNGGYYYSVTSLVINDIHFPFVSA